MASQSLSWKFQVDDRIREISNRLDGKDNFNHEDAPGLKDLLDRYLASPDLKPEDFLRSFMKIFKDSKTDGAYSATLRQHTPEEQKRVEAFVAGQSLEEVAHDFIIGPSLAVRQELQKLHQAHEIAHVSASGVTALEAVPTISETNLDALAVRFEKLQRHFSESFHEVTESLYNFIVECTESRPPSLQGQAALEDTSSLIVINDEPFQNWGLTVEFTPKITCVPTTVKAIQSVVAFAKAHDMSVRCSGYRHSWSPIFGRKGQIILSMIALDMATKLPNPAALPLPEAPPTPLETIEEVSTPPRTPGNTLVRIGCATTNERLRRWCVEHNKLTLPLNVIMVEITLGGSNAPICHGAGRRNQTLSDLVRKIEYVDANGQLRSVERPEHLRAASGCFGLMGVVTHITLELSPMTYALLHPKKMPVSWAVPPPADLREEEIPPALLNDWKGLNPEQKKQHQQEFENRATNDSYSEWFWFPYSDFSWVNTWNDTKDASEVVDYPDPLNTTLQWAGTFAVQMAQQSKILSWLTSQTQIAEASTTILSRLAMEMLPAPESPIKTYLPDALHFQRGIQNVRVRDIEVEMPLVAKREDPKAINWQLVQRAWWDAILLVYKNSETCPMRMPLEMRIMGGSDVVMAPQRGNALGTCSIEVLTLQSKKDIWPPFAQSVLDKWMALKDPATGKPLRTRPHWATEWKDFVVDGRPWIERLRRDYADERKEFMQILTSIGEGAGWTLADLQARFSNEFFDDFFFGDDILPVGKAQA